MSDPDQVTAAKPLVWMGDSLNKVREFPPPVKDEIGFALYQAQIGKKHVNAKPLKGLGHGVMEIVSDYRGDTFRAVYMVRWAHKVYFLHAFQKKSKSGIATPRPAIELIKQRLKRAVQLHMEGGI
jgi:phage-related protein